MIHSLITVDSMDSVLQCDHIHSKAVEQHFTALFCTWFCNFGLGTVGSERVQSHTIHPNEIKD